MRTSQILRQKAPEMDSLRIGSGWTLEDLEKPQIYINSTFGDSHPGSAHLQEVVNEISIGITEYGGKAARYFCTDICDGQAQGHEGMSYSLVSREYIADMIEIQVGATPFDAGVFVASCDKAVPGHLKAMARMNMPAIFVPGGVMSAGPNSLTLEQIGTYKAKFERGEISEEEFDSFKRTACPSCGACCFMGTASTMQVMAEALGLALPGSALIPSGLLSLRRAARRAGRFAVEMADQDLTPAKIVTYESFENAIMVHAAIAGSSNAVLHLPAVAHEFGIELEPDIFDQINRRIPWLLNVRPSGKFTADQFWRAGGTLAIMKELKDHLHWDAMTVTGETLAENMETMEDNGFFKMRRGDLKVYGMVKEDIIRPVDNPLSKEGSLAVLKGNLAPEGCITKHSAIEPEMHRAILRARVFDCEEDAREEVYRKKIQPGDAVIIRYEGPKGAGMPEMFYTTEAIASDPELVSTTALITDGRFSGATRGPAIGHVSPEAMDGGPIALVENDDLIEIDIPARKLAIIGIRGQRMNEKEIAKNLEERRRNWIKPEPRFTKGVLSRYVRTAVSPIKGGYMA